jgi:hypothetical protein
MQKLELAATALLARDLGGRTGVNESAMLTVQTDSDLADPRQPPARRVNPRAPPS